mgnify:FL=1
MKEKVKIVEVAPRDGLQNEEKTLSVTERAAFIEALAGAGLKTIEAGAFVSPKWVPQMAETGEVLEALNLGNDVSLPCLVPNERGMQDAIKAGAKEVAVFTAASEKFNLKNTNATIEESFERFAPVMKLAREQGIKVRGYVSTAIACPYSGKVDPEKVAQVASDLFELGCYEVSLGDTIGVGRPKEIQHMLRAVMLQVPKINVALHLHDTFGQALAGIYAALGEGVRTFDASCGGLGGCPYAKGATGNVATEDVLYLLEGEGFDTGVDLDAVRKVSENIFKGLGAQPRSKVTNALKGQ